MRWRMPVYDSCRDFIDQGCIRRRTDTSTPRRVAKPTPSVFGTWQRLNISRDDYAIEHEF